MALRLAESGEQMTLGELAEVERLPEPTVAKILAKLRRAGIARATRGRKGGYELVASPEETTVAQLVHALGSTRTPGRFCQAGHMNAAECHHSGDCSLRSVWDFLEARMFQVLENTSLADLQKTRRQIDVHLEGLWLSGEAEARENETSRGTT